MTHDPWTAEDLALYVAQRKRKPRPSIEELERILADEEYAPVEILPNGTIREIGTDKSGKVLTMREDLGGEYDVDIMARPPAPPGEPTCRVCGCWEYAACWDDDCGACWWVEPDLCSHCAVEAAARTETATCCSQFPPT